MAADGTEAPTATASADDDDEPSPAATARSAGVQLGSVLVDHGFRTTFVGTHCGRRVVFKWYRPGTTTKSQVAAHRDVLARLDPTRRRLVLPSVLGTGFGDHGEGYVVLEHLSGDDLRLRWSYARPATIGGRALDARIVDHLVEVLDDLRAADAAPAIAAGFRRPVRHPGLDDGARSAVADGLVTSEVARRVDDVLQALPDRSGHVETVSNEDFRASNVIQLPDERIALVDWDGARASAWEVERCLAYLWVTLFERRDLRDRLVERAALVLGVDPVVVGTFAAQRALVQAELCRSMPGVRATLAGLTAEALALHTGRGEQS